jgi:hypothetical protein
VPGNHDLSWDEPVYNWKPARAANIKKLAGAGSFGAVAKHRPESTPRLYNLVEAARDYSSIKIHTRCMRKEGGAWEPHAIWPGEKPGERRAYYVIR